MPADMIIAGGAIRDLYFNRESRDVDLYYNTKNINAASFANCLNRLDIEAMARAAGFESVSIRRNSDGTLIGKPTDTEGEDWGDVSEDAKITLRSWATVYHRCIQGGQSPAQAVMAAHQGVPQAALFFFSTSLRQYITHLIEHGPSGSSSAGGANGKSTHPLQSVEEFRVIFDDYHHVDVELMGVASAPVDYIMTHFAVKLSRAYYDGRGVHFTSDFMRDALNKTLTVACPVEHARFERLFSYYLPKMKKYFPDFDVRVDLNAMNGRDW